MKIERSEIIQKISQAKLRGFDYLVKITAVDYVDHLDVIYLLRDLEKPAEEVFEVSVDPSDLWVPTIIHHHSSADWYERELSEMFGIEIKGRKAPRLLLEKWDGKGSPLRKNFRWGEPYDMM